MKQKIITNSIIFVLIIAFISGFSAIFGDANTLVGVGIATIALVLVERDLTIHPILNTLKLLVINLSLGIFAYISHGNIWIGVFLNFIALFFIGYVFSYNIRKSIVLPFGLTYLFMFYMPVEGVDVMNRMYALIVGTFLIMLLQFVFNKNRYSKVGIKSTEDIYKNILIKIEDIKNDRETVEIDKNIQTNIKAVKKVILDKRAKGFYLTKSGDSLTDVIWSLERISILLDEFKIESKNLDYISFLDTLHLKLDNLLTSKTNKYSLKSMFSESTLNKQYTDEFDRLIGRLNNDMENVLIWDERGLELAKIDVKIPKHFKKLMNHKRDFGLKSLRFSFGLRLAVSVTVVVFITEWFKLREGRWMAYTVFSLIQPYYEYCKTKAKERVQGTIIGAIIVLIAFSLIKNTGGRFVVIMLAGYLNPFFTNYRDIAITITVSAIASAALSGGTTQFVLARVAFVLIGTGIALLANRFILPFRIEDGKKTIVDIYDYIARQMLRDVKSMESESSMKSLFLLPSLIEDRMHLLNFGVNCEKESEFITNRRVLINNIYKHYMSIKRNDESEQDIDALIKEMEDSLNDGSKIREEMG